MPIPEENKTQNISELSPEQKLALFVNQGYWSEITPDNFPFLTEPLELQAFVEKACDNRLARIDLEIKQLSMFGSLLGNNEEGLSKINGVVQSLSQEVMQIFQIRYPDIQPVPLSREQKLQFDRDVNSKISFLVNQGEVEKLNVKEIPELALLEEETILELKIDALFFRLDRYKDWEGKWKEAEKWRGENKDLPHIPTIARESTPDSPIEKIIKDEVKETMQEITELATRLKKLKEENRKK